MHFIAKTIKCFEVFQYLRLDKGRLQKHCNRIGTVRHCLFSNMEGGDLSVAHPVCRSIWTYT